MREISSSPCVLHFLLNLAELAGCDFESLNQLSPRLLALPAHSLAPLQLESRRSCEQGRRDSDRCPTTPLAPSNGTPRSLRASRDTRRKVSRRLFSPQRSAQLIFEAGHDFSSGADNDSL